MIINNSRFLTHKVTGVQRYAIEISLILQRIYPNMTFVSPGNILQKNLAKGFGVNTCGKLTGHLWEQTELPFYLRKKGSPVLLNLANTAPVFYRNKIVTIHDLACLNPDWFSRKFTYFYRNLIPKITNNSLKIVTVSEFSKRELIKHFNIPENKVEIIHDAVSQKFISLASGDFENKYGDYILAVSSLSPRKNFKSLIIAFNRLKLKDIKLILVGSGDKIYENPDLKDLVKENPNIVFTGYVTDKELAGLYKNARLFVFPSLYEGFGIPPLEAMACNCPTVVSNATSIPEVCGKASYYVDPASIDSIAKGIYEVLNNEQLQNELRQKGAERIKVFNWQDSAKKIAQIIKDL